MQVGVEVWGFNVVDKSIQLEMSANRVKKVNKIHLSRGQGH